MKKILFAAAVALFVGIAACNDDNGPSYPTVETRQAEDFVDSRDGKVYKCVEIGSQIWLAENLAYRLPGGLDNRDCRTWQEELLEVSPDDVVDDATLVAALKEANEKGELANPWAKYWFVEGGFWTIFWGYVYDARAGEFEPQLQSGLNYLVNKNNADTVQVVLDDVERVKLSAAKPLIEKRLAEHYLEAEKNNGYYTDTYGLLYSLEGAREAVPAEGGWRLPTDEDWKKLESCLGMSKEEIEKSDGWRGTVEGELLKKGTHGIGFDVLYGGGKMFDTSYSKWIDRHSYSRQGQNAYFWANEERADSDTTSLGMIRSVAVFSEQILRTTTRLKALDKENSEKYYPTLFSVRLVKDKE